MKKMTVLSYERIKSVLDIIDNPSEKAAEDVTHIASHITPRGDFFYFAKEFREIVKQDLDYRMDKNQIDENLKNILYFSESDSVGKLAQNYFGLDSIRSQANDAQDIFKSNISVVTRLFEEQLLKKFEELKNGPKDNFLDHDDKLSLLCVKSLLIPSSPFLGEVDLRNYCQNRIFYSVNLGHMIVYNNYSDLKLSYEKRACLLYNFFRKSRLIELVQKQKRIQTRPN